MNILITSAGRRVSLVQIFQKELKELIPDGLVMTTDSNIKLSPACHVADGAFQTPSVIEANYIDVLINLCLENNIKLIIPTIDTELLILSQNSKIFTKNGIVVVVSSEELIKNCTDKRKMNLLFRSYDIEVPHEYSKKKYKLPLYIKPNDGSRSQDNFIVRKNEELRDYFFNNDKFMFLEYLDHDCYEEFTCDLYYDKFNNLKCVVPRKRIEVRDGEVSKGLTEKNELIGFIKERLGYIEGALGCLTSQFFKHKKTGRIYGIEINARFGGGFPLTYLSGANYVRWIINEYFYNKDIDFYADWESNLLMLRYDDAILVHDDTK